MRAVLTEDQQKTFDENLKAMASMRRRPPGR
jgi:hypothetical protein